MDFAFMDELQKYDWDMEPEDRSIDAGRVEKFLDKTADPEIKSAIETIIKNTVYITYKNMKENLLGLIGSLPNKFNLFFPLNYRKVGSEHWIMVMLWPYVRSRVYKIINSHLDLIQTDSSCEKNNYPLVAFDDCIYSGVSMCSIFDDLQYERRIYNKQAKNREPLQNEFWAVTAYRGINSTYQLENDFKVKVISGTIIAPLDLGKDSDYMYQNFGCETKDTLPIYFDHKIANKFGSYPDIYSRIIKNPVSRYQIEKLKSLLNARAHS